MPNLYTDTIIALIGAFSSLLAFMSWQFIVIPTVLYLIAGICYVTRKCQEKIEKSYESQIKQSRQNLKGSSEKNSKFINW